MLVQTFGVGKKQTVFRSQPTKTCVDGIRTVSSNQENTNPNPGSVAGLANKERNHSMRAQSGTRDLKVEPTWFKSEQGTPPPKVHQVLSSTDVERHTTGTARLSASTEGNPSRQEPNADLLIVLPGKVAGPHLVANVSSVLNIDQQVLMDIMSRNESAMPQHLLGITHVQPEIEL